MFSRRFRLAVARRLEKWRTKQRIKRLMALRESDRNAFLALIGEAGRAVAVWHSRFAGNGVRTAKKLTGVVTTTWNQPPVTVPIMAHDRLILALASCAAASVFQRRGDTARITTEDLGDAIRLASSIAGTEEVMGKRIPYVWGESTMPSILRLQNVALPTLPERAVEILSHAYGRIYEQCLWMPREELLAIAALIHERSTQGRAVTGIDLRRIMGDRPQSAHRECLAHRRSAENHYAPLT